MLMAGCGRESPRVADVGETELDLRGPPNQQRPKAAVKPVSEKERKEMAAPVANREPAPTVEKLAALSATGYAWDGTYSGYVYAVAFDAAVQKATKALERRGFTLDPAATRRARDQAALFAKTPAGLACEVRLRAVDKGGMEFRVKVGVTGDRTASETILHEVRKELATK